jgi:hypothetical protein
MAVIVVIAALVFVRDATTFVDVGVQNGLSGKW